MARAKRTERAEARRRHRATLATETAAAGDLDAAVEAGASPTARARGATAQTASAQPGARPSLTDAFRSAIRPINLREDLAYAPTLIFRTKAVVLPLALCAGSAVVFLSAPDSSLGAIAFNLFIVTPPVLTAFLAGFLAPRASYIAGAVVGLVAALVFVAIFLSRPDLVIEGTPTEAQRFEVVSGALLVSPAVGGLYAAAAAWYRRFLTYARPAQQRKAPPKKRR